jgi:prophage regulatory protein
MKNQPALTSTTPPEDERILSYPEVERATDLDRTTIWREVTKGRFPPPIQLTPSRKGWRWTSILAWMADREANPIQARTYHKPAKGVFNGKKKPAADATL